MPVGANAEPEDAAASAAAAAKMVLWLNSMVLVVDVLQRENIMATARNSMEERRVFFFI